MPRANSRSLSPFGACSTCYGSDSESANNAAVTAAETNSAEPTNDLAPVSQAETVSVPSPVVASSKRKLDDDDSSSQEPTKRFKQDSSEVTRDDTVMPDYGRGGDDAE